MSDVQAKLDWVREHHAKVLPDEADGARELYRTGPLVGTPDQVVEKLQKLDVVGLAYAICYFVDAAYDTSSIELFEREVMPALRS